MKGEGEGGGRKSLNSHHHKKGTLFTNQVVEEIAEEVVFSS